MKKNLTIASVGLNIMLIAALYIFSSKEPQEGSSIHVDRMMDDIRERTIEAEREIAIVAFGEENIDEYMELFVSAFNGNGPYGMMVANERMLWKPLAARRGRILSFPIDSLDQFTGTSNQSQ
jgi:hypothetical protein